jgi:hypothetical protein
MNLTPQESEIRQLLLKPARKSNVYGLSVAAISMAFFVTGFFSSDRAAFFAGGYAVAIYAFLKYLFAGFRYSESVRALIEKYEARIRELEEKEPMQPPVPTRGNGP